MRIIQFSGRQGQSTVGIVEEESIQILHTVQTTYGLFFYAEENRIEIQEAASRLASATYENYESILEEGRILLPLQHPDPYHTWITGTGLTHLGSAASRDQMHKKLASKQASELTDSMKMFGMGIENGKMKDGIPASQPEWFYKGNGLMAVHPGEPIPSPAFALQGSEEPEIVGLYIINSQGVPSQIGFSVANEFSDHKMEAINYLYLAHSKLRHCSYGPELLLGRLPAHIEGKSRILREEKCIWEKPFLTGEDNMSHNIANLEYHHFKYPLFRQKGDVHVHFFGTSVLSYTEGIEVQHGDVFEIEAAPFGKPLRNPLQLS
jgi:hypothetical protein